MKERLYHQSVARELLLRHGFTIKKGMGQNFLIDIGVLDDIVEAAIEDQTPNCFRIALEIGPGIGVLTQALAECGFDRVIAIEKDRHLMPVLRETLADYPHVEVVAGDALKTDFAALLKDVPENASVRFVANLPYYVTSPLLMHMLESGLSLERLVVMVQKEVAERMVAPPGGKDYGALSVAVQYYSHPQLLRTVSPGSFYPSPTVESAVVRLHIRTTPFAPDVRREYFFRVVRAAFGHRRKTLLNALHSEFITCGKDTLETWLNTARIDGKRRGETLHLEEFAALARAYQRSIFT